MASTLEKKIETSGPDKFAVLVPQFESLNLISQNQTDRLEHAELRDTWLYCGDGVVYGLKGQEVFLYLTDFVNNPLRKNPKKAPRELIRNHNFFVDKSTASDIESKVSASKGVVAFNLSELPVQKENNEWGYIEVSTSKLAEGKEAFKTQYGDKVTALFDRVHGDAVYGSNGIGDLLSKQSKDTTRIYMLNKEYIQKILKSKEEGTMVARVSFLANFGSNSDVNRSPRLRGIWGRARGVLKEGDEQKIIPYEDALKEADKIAPKGTYLNPVLVGLINTIYNRQ